MEYPEDPGPPGEMACMHSFIFRGNCGLAKSDMKHKQNKNRLITYDHGRIVVDDQCIFT
jgi:hypothetical protein